MDSSISQQISDIESLFISNPQNAILECQKFICKSSHFDSYDQFYNYHLNHSHISTCQREWKENRMSIHCFDCSITNSSCLCLQCFLNGNHEGHNYSICPETIGNCDCGDTSLWKRTGFCKNHQGLKDSDNPESYLEDELKTTLTDLVFKSSFLALKKLKITEDQISSENLQTQNATASVIFQFITSFLKFGDGFRRLIAISLTEKIEFYEFLSNVTSYSIQFNQLFLELCGNLINDQIFKQNFSKVTYSLIPNYMKNPENKIHELWASFFYHSFTPQPIQYNITANRWNWIDFFLDFLRESKEFFRFVGDEDFTKSYPNFSSSLINSVSFATSYQPNDETQLFFDRLFCEVLNCGSENSLKNGSNDSVIPASFHSKTEKLYYFAAESFILLIYPLFNCFKFKKNLKYEALIEQLDINCDISPIYNQNSNANDKLVFKFMNKDDKYDKEEVTIFPYFYYGSFHNGASFFFSMPLYDSFVTILGLENICKIKIARLLLDEKYQKLRIKLGIITLKKILSFICFSQSLTQKNFGLIKMIESDAESADYATFGVSRYLPVFQLLIGLQCNSTKDEFCIKEFFAYEMAKEIGLFDDFTSEDYDNENIDENRNKMFFSFLYLSLLFVIERNLFNFDSNNFIREQLIFALKSGQSDINKLNQSYDKRVLDDFENPINFNTVLFNIASIQTCKKEGSEKEDISYVLKDDINYNPISAIIPINKQKSLLNNEISKNPNSLINIQKFEPEENYFFNTTLFSPSSLTTKTYNSKSKKIENEVADFTGLNIRLKELLMTPTVLAVVYHSLRTNLELNQIDLNDHLSLNILILVSKFLQEKNDDNENDELAFIEQINYDSLEDLIDKFKNIIFNYKNDSIENKLNKKNFISILNLKISYQNKKNLSFIELISSKGEIGKISLNKMSINQSSNQSENENPTDEKIVKKQRANKLKEEILNKYKNMISNYNEHDSIESFDSTDCLLSPTSSGVMNGTTDVCSICSSIKKNENLSFPLFMYKTKFPFIVDKPPLTQGEKGEISVSCDDDVDYDDEEEEEKNEEKNNEEEEQNDIEKLQEIEMQLESLNSLFQQFLNDRESNSISNHSFASTLASFQRIRQELLIQKEVTQGRIFSRELKKKKKEIKRQHKISRDDDENSKPKRFTIGANFIVQFSLCQHQVHPSCIEKDIFNCPIDRTIKNGFLPSLESSSPNSLTENEKGSIDAFLSSFRRMIISLPSRKIDLFAELIKSLSGLIVTFEIRLRSLPNCLDSNSTTLLARNLFLATWHGYRMKGKPPITDTKPYNNTTKSDIDSRMTLFQKFIKKLIEEDEITSVESIVGSFISSLNKEEEIFLFLRRVCLANYFFLRKSENYLDFNHKLVEWDEILSVSSLSKQFNVSFKFLREDFELKPFVPSVLPNEFLHFALEPFNFPVELTQKFTVYNLIDYNFLIDNYDDFSVKCDVKKEEKSLTFDSKSLKLSLIVNYNLKHYPSALLLIGKYASRILFITDCFTTSLKPFYLDRYGSPDFEFSRGEPLYLNEERYERFIDDVLSGNFSNSI